MYNLKIFQIQLEIIINNNLYKKNIIDEAVFVSINEKLLYKLKELQ
jgi:hypothetical protein